MTMRKLKWQDENRKKCRGLTKKSSDRQLVGADCSDTVSGGRHVPVGSDHAVHPPAPCSKSRARQHSTKRLR
jgi:hypothetical protein